jgi:hypothetical protein
MIIPKVSSEELHHPPTQICIYDGAVIGIQRGQRAIQNSSPDEHRFHASLAPKILLFQ